MSTDRFASDDFLDPRPCIGKDAEICAGLGCKDEACCTLGWEPIDAGEEKPSPESVLRRASARIRELAAGAPRSPWSTGRSGRVVATPIAAGSSITVAVADTYPTGGSARQQATTDYIASWHPLVALAVADLLDAVAEDVAENSILDRPETGECQPIAPEAWWCDYCGGAIESADYIEDSQRCQCQRLAKALDLARLYLGEPGPITADSTAALTSAPASGSLSA